MVKPIPIPEEAWTGICMDFWTGLPKEDGKEVVVYRLTKYGHFIPLSHPFSASTVAQVFLDHIYKLHGLPTSRITVWDPILTSLFWRELFSQLGVKLIFSTAYHPQSDGQTERLNQCIFTVHGY